MASLDLPPVPPAEGETFNHLKVLVSSLFSSPGSLISGAVAAFATGAICLYATSHVVFVDWLLMSVLLNIYRLSYLRFFRDASDSITTISQLKYYERHFVIGATLQSLSLGVCAALAILLTDNAAAQIASVASAIAFCAGFVARNAARPRFVTAQLLLTTAPMILAFFISDAPAFALIGVFSVLFVTSNVVQTRSVHSNLMALSRATQSEKVLTQAVKDKNRTLGIALANMSQGLAMFDDDGRLTLANDRFMALLASDGDLNVRTLPAGQLASLLVARGVLSREAARMLHNGWKTMQGENRSVRFDLKSIHDAVLDVILSPVDDGGFLMTVEDVTLARRAQAKIEHLARFDELTGLLNRHEANARLTRRCVTQEPFLVAYLDIARFKEINDRFGHELGDQVLQAVGKRLSGFVKDDGFVGRLGGDEFILVLDSRDHAHAAKLLLRVAASLEKPFHIAGRSLKAPARIGFSMFPEHGTDALVLQRSADLALYRSKVSKSVGPMLYETEMGQTAARLRDMEEDLRKALVHGGLELYYQPIIELGSKRIVSFEALMRWKHPVRGFVPPSEFIPVAESTNLIIELGEWAIQEAARSIAAWPSHISVAVNVSPIQFAQGDRLIEVVQSALSSAGISPQQLTLEVTESVLIDDTGTVRDTMIKLNALGIKCALDDFGTGYSSLGYLASFPFYCVKIDRCFVKDVEDSRGSRATVEAVCHLAQTLGILTVAEGIEEEGQGVVLTSIGVDRAQGYFYGRPAPWAEVSEKLLKAA